MERRNQRDRRRAVRGVGARLSEAPERLAGLKAWFDSRTPDYMTLSSGISSWVSRAGSMGSISLAQATGSAQPTYATAVSTLGNQNAVQFTATSNQRLDASTASQWRFLHDNTGSTAFWIGRMVDNAGANQIWWSTSAGTEANIGVRDLFGATLIPMRVNNGSGTSHQNTINVNVAAQYARDVSQWRAITYGGGVRSMMVSGSTVTNPDVVGQVASTSNPDIPLRVGITTALNSALNGYLAQLIFYDRVLTSTELSQLTAWANEQYGVSP